MLNFDGSIHWPILHLHVTSHLLYLVAIGVCGVTSAGMTTVNFYVLKLYTAALSADTNAPITDEPIIEPLVLKRGHRLSYPNGCSKIATRLQC